VPAPPDRGADPLVATPVEDYERRTGARAATTAVYVHRYGRGALQAEGPHTAVRRRSGSRSARSSN